MSRSITVKTPLGSDELLFCRMMASESLGSSFAYTVELLSPDANLAVGDLLGKNMTIELALEGEAVRYFDGIVSRFSFRAQEGDNALYEATLVPWLALLNYRSDCRIFQHLSVPDVIKKIFREHGMTHFEEALVRTYAQKEYQVQYRESDLDFVNRLMEQEGIYYFFRHEEGKHTLVLADSYSAHGKIPGYEEIPYFPPHHSEMRERDHIDSWSLTACIAPVSYELNAFDFEKPKANLVARLTDSEAGDYPRREIYEYTGQYSEASEGETYVRLRLERERAMHSQTDGGGNARGLAVGSLFTLTGFPRADQNKEYLVVSASYELSDDGYASGTGGAGGGGPTFRCTFQAIDAKVPFRSPIQTPRPMIRGVQTAVVVGKSGEEIWTDSYGRVKVQFHWDREGKRDEQSSCWVRVAHGWAGGRWGSLHIPRLGQEVVVCFVEGDPDRPLITGSVYNADNMPPYTLPAQQTQSGIKSRSTKGGSESNFNELRFEDDKGQEHVFLHAEKDHQRVVKNDEAVSVGHDRKKAITNDEKVEVGGNRTEEVTKNESVKVGENRTLEVVGDEAVTVKGKRNDSVTLDSVATVGGNYERSVDRNASVTVTGARTDSVGNDASVSVGGGLTHSVEKDASYTVRGAQKVNVSENASTTVGGDQSVDVTGAQEVGVGTDSSINVGGALSGSVGKDGALDIGKALALTAGDAITLKVGDASISMKKNGEITIKGKNITLDGSGKIQVKASSDLSLKGSKISEN